MPYDFISWLCLCNTKAPFPLKNNKRLITPWFCFEDPLSAPVVWVQLQPLLAAPPGQAFGQAKWGPFSHMYWSRKRQWHKLARWDAIPGFLSELCKVETVVPPAMVGYEPGPATLLPLWEKLPVNHSKTEEKRVKRWRVTDPWTCCCNTWIHPFLKPQHPGLFSYICQYYPHSTSPFWVGFLSLGIRRVFANILSKLQILGL